ncbi:YoaK family protein [[Clostridium] hylemonae]|uniref:DUF1275 domain-containing protein n=1 Tax=[Clostridium] hylemonae DSM 15053 TaxID=553973 RepID=C0BYS8_9FIRM|nr:YoaK family protein [[Clostridium] hylemonae]EEG75006.1 hypothetical protein CLOHYLEM_04967 [[Clostridium] hylemonae DSM 15053]QEK18353.1 hypothetical protein LAJLEIBI_02370 [[Clostridium] hylemonae DSM 15053]BDF05367.1 membrane protein [[Clostridium] hylemonae]
MEGKQPGTAAVPIHETFRIAALLAVVGGFLDAYTYILRGGVFANAQTGNMVLLGVYAAQGRYRQAGYCIIPILAFALGVFITEVFKKYFTEKEFNIYEHWIIAIEIILLSVVGFVPASVPDSVVNVTISFVCSLQVNSFRKMKNLPYASTMCTGNLRSGTEKLFQYVINKETKAGIQAAHYFGIILLFILGAVAGTVLAFLWGIQSIWCCSILLGIVFVTMCLTIR